ncbi:MAG: hypothetical protein Q8781_01560 [Candidatus Phytoplasma stylosanthis]|uniref:hypothetical protein n=1 Tax=Candidatus Phytoplasma stylosanthis TaxID=2798314 RepID=UPI00293A17FB|nr:hypothetical protein [Candidatus Phytoplasma stylosanthis]MDV3167750.1 hypothetical protein [Candidatus Phytoplasma stylosanthis]MDV3170974.1 hypothetical protein [Candidatus Phytoplasma stylosanthis]MDV3174146.1 hypothetical protein [Candidatus Phytoplasma stylosanthis]MDV3202335.1 hypothetical protein [Candidatus Phytoplasma stylosanthis]
MNQKKIFIWLYSLLFINLFLIGIIYENKNNNFIFSTNLSEREITAFHEAGHALIDLSYPELIDVEYATIKKTKRSLGHVKCSFKENNNDIRVLSLLGGIAAETLLAEDNKMDKKQVGKGSLEGPTSDLTKAKKIMPALKNKEQFKFFLNQSKEIIKKNENIWKNIANKLISKTTLTSSELKKIIKEKGPIK